MNGWGRRDGRAGVRRGKQRIGEKRQVKGISERQERLDKMNGWMDGAMKVKVMNECVSMKGRINGRAKGRLEIWKNEWAGR